MRSAVAFLALIALLAGAEAARLPFSAAQRARLLVDTTGSDPRGSDTRGADPIGKGNTGTVSQPYAAQAPVSAASAAGAPSVGQAPMVSSLSLKTPTDANVGPYKAPLDSSMAPMSAPAGESAPSVTGRRLQVDTRGADPVGRDTRGSDPMGHGSSLSGQPYGAYAPGPSASSSLYASVPAASSGSVVAPTTAPSGTSAPSLSR